MLVTTLTKTIVISEEKDDHNEEPHYYDSKLIGIFKDRNNALKYAENLYSINDINTDISYNLGYESYIITLDDSDFLIEITTSDVYCDFQ